MGYKELTPSNLILTMKVCQRIISVWILEESKNVLQEMLQAHEDKTASVGYVFSSVPESYVPCVTTPGS